jgi:hypothetical protein
MVNPTIPAGIYYFANNKKLRFIQNIIAPRRKRPINTSKINSVIIIIINEAINDVATIIPVIYLFIYIFLFFSEALSSRLLRAAKAPGYI